MGSLEAANDELAVVLARENYVRRAEGELMWVVDRDHVIVGDEDVHRPQRRQAAPSQRRLAGRRAAARRTGRDVTNPGGP